MPRKKLINIYNISEIKFINEFCFDDNANRLFVSPSKGVVALLVNDDDDRWRDVIGGRTSRFLVDTFVVDGKSSLLPVYNSS